MDLQFEKSACRCLQQVKYETKEQEQTHQLRLEDALPDIGTVVCAWGQVILRSKEWQNGQLSVSGGVMAWITYMPEDNSELQKVETWLPFQLHWDVGDTQQEGTFLCSCLLRSIDARVVSARKLMVRAVTSVLAQALVPEEFELYSPPQLPQDVQILRNSYPVLLPVEVGEKPFALEEELALPGTHPSAEKLIRYAVQPELIDKKVLGGRLVFRGTLRIHILYQSEDTHLYNCDLEVPFSQYTELDGSYEQEAAATVLMAVTGMELENLPEGKFLLKAGLTGQYVVYDRCMLELSEDAYSTKRPVQLSQQQLQLPVVLNMQSQSLRAECTVQSPMTKPVDVEFYPHHSQLRNTDDGAELMLSGQFRVLYCDENGQLQCTSPGWESMLKLSAGEATHICRHISPTGKVQMIATGECSAGVLADTVCMGGQGLRMLTGLSLEEEERDETERPSLILRRKGSDSLWDVAKSCGSTVEAIRQANRLEAEPEEDQMLLIPVS